MALLIGFPDGIISSIFFPDSDGMGTIFLSYLISYQSTNEQLSFEGKLKKESIMKKYVGYYRVSSHKQGKSGLGLEGQKTMVGNFLKSNQGQLINSFTEVETGTSKKQRIEIFKAIEFAKKNDAVLLIAKLDRLARNVHFVSSLMEAGVEFVCCDMPSANNLTVFILSAIAEEEAKTISLRTRIALAEKKKQGFKLGTPENFNYEHRMKGGDAMRTKSLENRINIQATALIIEYRGKGMSYGKIAAKLGALNFKTVTSKDFTSTGVMRLYKRHLNKISIADEQNQAA